MGGVDKMLAPLAGRPLIARTIAAIAASQLVERVVVVVSEANEASVASIAREVAPGAVVVLGGERRRDSVLAGLEELTGCEHVLVHDGARPLVTQAAIERAYEAAQKDGAAICAVQVHDTIKRVDAEGMVTSTVSRSGVWLVQTPQVFHAGLLMMAHEHSELDATDDASLVELMGAPVRVVQGDVRNIKVTTPEDLRLAEALLSLDGETA